MNKYVALERINEILLEYPLAGQINRQIDAILSEKNYDLKKQPDNFVAPKVLMAAALMRIAKEMLVAPYDKVAMRLAK